VPDPVAQAVVLVLGDGFVGLVGDLHQPPPGVVGVLVVLVVVGQLARGGVGKAAVVAALVVGVPGSTELAPMLANSYQWHEVARPQCHQCHPA
jgi:hypothetical protein